MKSKCFIGLGLALFILLTFTDSAFAYTGKITKVKGSVLLINGRARSYARVGSTVRRGTIIKTGFRSYAYLKIRNTYSRVGQLSRVQVARLAPRTRTHPSRVQLNLRRGKLRAIVSKLKKRGRFTSFKVRTPVSVASVRGTEIEVSHGPGFGTLVKFITGYGAFASILNQSRSIKKGQQSRVRKGNSPSSNFSEGNSKSNAIKGSAGHSNEEGNNINNSDSIALNPKIEDPIDYFYNFTKGSKKRADVTINVDFP